MLGRRALPAGRLARLGATPDFHHGLLAQTAAPTLFDYDRTRPLDVRETMRREDTGAVLRDITYATLNGGRNAATLITPSTAAGRAAPAVLFVHWYGPPAPTSNRTQFIPDGIALARQGVTSLLIDTPWSLPTYFRSRTRDEDYARSVQQVRDLRRALDVLMAQPGVDPTRVAYVGHDFGAMYGTLAAAVDPRITHFVFMAGTASFSDWFLYGPKLEGEARNRFIAQLAPLDPVRWLPRLRGPVLMQFADTDEHVSTARREQLAAAAPQGTEVRVYKAGHELSEESTRERLEWLSKVLRLM
jgi:cephalosporin-C deacetylase-like acetyl esterase